MPHTPYSIDATVFGPVYCVGLKCCCGHHRCMAVKHPIRQLPYVRNGNVWQYLGSAYEIPNSIKYRLRIKIGSDQIQSASWVEFNKRFAQRPNSVKYRMKTMCFAQFTSLIHTYIQTSWCNITCTYFILIHNL